MFAVVKVDPKRVFPFLKKLINTPVTYGDLQLTDKDWQFKAERQVNQNNRVSLWPRGKVLGKFFTRMKSTHSTAPLIPFVYL